MALRKFEKVILALVSSMVLAIVVCGLYIFVYQSNLSKERDSSLELRPVELDAGKDQTKPEGQSSKKANEQKVSLPGVLVMPGNRQEKPAVANVSLEDIWDQTGFKSFTGLVEPEDVKNLAINYTEYNVPLLFETIELPSEDLYVGERVVHQEGQEGELVVTTRNVYLGQELMETEEVSSLVLKAQVNQIVYYGTKLAPVEPATSITAALTEAPVESDTKTETTPETETESISASQNVESEYVEEDSEGALATPGSGDFLQFVAASGNATSVNANLDILRMNGILGTAGRQQLYDSFADNGGFITVNGINVPYSSKVAKTTTSYDGLLCCIYAKDHNPPINHNTASGVPANIGLCASNEYPFGTVLFVEGYGFCIVADRHGTGQYPDLVDVCYAPGEVEMYTFGLAKRNVYIISIP